MKISKRQKAKTRAAIIKAAVDQVIEKGVKAATMRSIARQAEVGDATIYNYFATKEAIFYAYYEDRFEAAAKRLEGAKGYDEHTLQERLQGLFEEQLECFLADREFVQATFKLVFFAMPPNHRELQPIQASFIGAVDRTMDAARERGELEDLVFRELVPRLFWDYFNGIAAYWINDESEQFTATSVLIDKTMALACAMLKAGVMNKVFDIFSFLFRNHVLAHLESFQPGVNAFQKLGRILKEGVDGRPGSQG